MDYSSIIYAVYGGNLENVTRCVSAQADFVRVKGRGKRTPSPWNSHPRLWIPSSFSCYFSFIHRWSSYSQRNGKLHDAKAVRRSHDAFLHKARTIFSPNSLPNLLAVVCCNTKEFTRTFLLSSSLQGHPHWAVSRRTAPGLWENLFPSQASWPL